jgi:ATP-binding cassette subfamily B (MDR/TAP) protein 1
LELKPSIQENDKNRKIGQTAHSKIGVDNIRFSYPIRPQVEMLRAVNLSVSLSRLQKEVEFNTPKVKQRQFVAFVGAFGCGKSTTIAILERFYNPSGGYFKFNDTNVDKINPKLFRKKIVLVQ